MRTGLFVILVFSLAVFQAHGRSVLECRPAGFDFGAVATGGTLVQDFWLHATGDMPVRVTDIKTGCSCVAVLVVDSSQGRVLQPGDSLQLRAAWQTRADTGMIARTLLVFSEGQADPLHISLQAVAGRTSTEAPVKLGPASLQLSQNRSAQRKPGRVRLSNQTDGELAIRRIGPEPPELSLQIPESLPAGTTQIATVAATDRYKTEDFEQSITLEFSGPNKRAYRMTLPVVKGDFSFRPHGSTPR